jgi:hypothetical protein
MASHHEVVEQHDAFVGALEPQPFEASNIGRTRPGMRRLDERGDHDA